MDREDHDARKALASLYLAFGNVDAALEHLNASADIRVEKGQFEAAEAVLREALTVRPGDVRTLAGLVEVFKKQGQPARAIALLEGEVASAPDSVQLLNILGNIHFEAGETKKAEEIFTRIVTGHPLNVNARIKLGRIQILKDKLDQAYELFEPLINNLVKKHKDEKAIGLLGLILESQKPHLPALERLALIYRSNKEVKKLEVVDRAIIDELRKIGDKERMVGIYNELVELRPDDADLVREAQSLRKEMGLVVEEVRDETPGLSEKDREAIREVMDQADLYLQQGLVRIARRLLENLRFRYPEDPQIVRKIAVIDEVRTHMDEDEIRRRVEKTTLLEAQIKEKAAGKKAEDKKAVEKAAAAKAEAGQGRGEGARAGPARDEKAGQPLQERRPRRREDQHRRHLRRDGHHPLRQRERRRADLLRPGAGGGRGAALDRRDPGPPAPGRRLAARTGAHGDRRRFPQGPQGAGRRPGCRDPLSARAGLHEPGPDRRSGRGADPRGRRQQAGRRELHPHQPVLPAEAEFRRGREVDEDGHGRDEGRNRSVFRPRLRARGDPGGFRRPGRRRGALPRDPRLESRLPERRRPSRKPRETLIDRGRTSASH
ncbi:MAG: tetratricopeptide repeat protein [Candidatus Moduliflexus flocculans]|nr:tetratricopeptide repeat protein [Candidatus Moduliflexus flocculans]